MEQVIENAVDTGLESISSGLYLFSIGIGIILVILGAFLFLSNKGSKGRKAGSNGGLICLAIGMIAVISGFVQMR